jgi:hypothetical protein
MDSHISKGNKRRTKQVTEKKNFIFSKSTYSLVFPPLGFENYITQVAAVIRDALPKPCDLKDMANKVVAFRCL